MSVWRPLSLCILLCLTLAAAPSLAVTPFEMTVASELAHGIPHDVAIQGNYAYVAAEGAVSVLDISNPSHPVQVAAIDTPGSAEGIAVSGNYAYVADWDSGLRIINIAIPAEPIEVGHYDTPGFAYGVAVQGDYAYVADHAAGLEIIDITTKSNPTSAGSYDTPGYAWSVAVSGDYAFVADGFAGLLVLNVVNPATPTVAGSCAAADRVMDVAIAGNVVCLADGAAGLRLVTVDAGPPFSLDCDAGALALTGTAIGVSVSGGLAYVAADLAGLHVVDIASPGGPALVDSYDTAGRAYAVAVAGTAAYVADDTGGLRVVEVSADPAPVIVGHAATTGNAEATAVSGSTVYVADGNGGVQAFNVSDPTTPAALWDPPCDTNWEAMDVAVASSDYLYVADWSAGLRILDVSGPTPVCNVATVPVTGNANGVSLSGSAVYVAAGTAGVAVFDAADLAAPTYLFTIDTDGSANDVVVAGDYAYIADGPAGLQIARVTVPTGVVGAADTGGYAWAVDYADNYAYVAAGDAGLVIVNVTASATPVIVASLPLSGSAHGVVLRDSYALVSVGGRGVVVVNVSNPAAPAVVTSVGTPSVPGPSDLSVAGGYAYVADAESGLVVVDILAPYVALATLESPASAERLALTASGDSGVGYIASGPAGLQIVQVTDSEEAIDPTLVRTNRTLGEVTDVAMSGTYSYVTDASGRLSIMNSSNPTNPFSVGAVDTSGSALGVAATQVSSSSYALVAGGYPGISTVRTSVVSSPTEQSVTDTPGWCSDVTTATLAGDPFALVADGDAGLRLLNLSTIGTPAITVLFENFETEAAFNLWGPQPIAEWYAGTAYEIHGTHGVRLRQTGSIERNISTVGFGDLSLSFYWRAAGLEATDYVVADWSPDGGVTWAELDRIADGDHEESALTRFSTTLSSAADDNPSFTLRFRIVADEGDDYAYVDDILLQSESSSQPSEVAFYNTPGQAVGVAVAVSGTSSYALVADGEAGLRVIDVTSPGAPIEVGHYDTVGYAEAVTTYGGNIAAVADGSDGVVLLDFTKPTGPVEVAYYDTPGWATDVKVLDGHAWVADNGWGLTILQLWHTFRDILFGHWAFFEIEDATNLDNIVGNRITTGYTDGKYHPELTCTRDQMCVFVARAMNLVEWNDPNMDQPGPGPALTFLDVREGHWAYKAIQACVNNGVVTGYSSQWFQPTGVVRRDMMCVFIARARGWIAVADPMDTNRNALFPDVGAQYWCGAAIQSCIDNGIVKGYNDGLFRPLASVTRDQMAVFIWRAFLH